jgi:hypothetical protein
MWLLDCAITVAVTDQGAVLGRNQTRARIAPERLRVGFEPHQAPERGTAKNAKKRQCYTGSQK